MREHSILRNSGGDLFISLTAAAGWLVYVLLVHRMQKKTRSVV